MGEVLGFGHHFAMILVLFILLVIIISAGFII